MGAFEVTKQAKPNLKILMAFNFVAVAHTFGILMDGRKIFAYGMHLGLWSMMSYEQDCVHGVILARGSPVVPETLAERANAP